jgi:N-acetylglutamate synthase-like GNAT family acetyltransferase
MDPLFKALGSKVFLKRDPAIRYVEERDIPAIAELFRSNYGEGYLARDVYDGRWVKRSIYSDMVICLVLEEEGKVLATGSVVLDYGDHNDKSAELARLAVHPDYSRHGLGRRVIDELFKVAENTAEFTFAEARTVHKHAQEMVETAFFPHIGFVPQLLHVGGKRESLALYAKLNLNGAFLRSQTPPQIIPDAAPLAHFVLAGMNLRDEIKVVDTTVINGEPSKYTMCPLTRDHVPHLLQIPEGRVTDPLLFGNISIEQGFAFVRDKASYLVALDSQQNPLGTIGYHFDETSRLIKGLELIARHNDVWPSLCRAFLQAGEELKAEVMTVDVSAYQPQLQRLLFGYGFRPVAYAPAMVFQGTERLDVIKMIKLNVPYDPGEMSLTPASKKVLALIEEGFR